MRRYIILAAMAALAASCTIADGNMERKPIDVGKSIAREAASRLDNTNEAICWALAADEYLSTEDESVRSDIYQNIFRCNLTPKINASRDTVSLVVDSGMTYYTYTTDGKLLSEGGKWKAWLDDITIEPKEGGIYEVRSDVDSSEHNATNKYALDIHNKVMDGYLSYDMSGTVEYVYDKEGGKSLSIEIDDKISYTSQLRSNRYGNRAIGFYNGKLNVTYIDIWAGYNDEVTLTYGDKNDGSVVVGYLGDKGSIEI